MTAALDAETALALRLLRDPRVLADARGGGPTIAGAMICPPGSGIYERERAEAAVRRALAAIDAEAVRS